MTTTPETAGPGREFSVASVPHGGNGESTVLGVPHARQIRKHPLNAAMTLVLVPW